MGGSVWIGHCWHLPLEVAVAPQPTGRVLQEGIPRT